MTIDGVPVRTIVDFCGIAFLIGIIIGGFIVWVIGSSSQRQREKRYQQIGRDLIDHWQGALAPVAVMKNNCQERELTFSERMRLARQAKQQRNTL